jgi:hypothetical protein
MFIDIYIHLCRYMYYVCINVNICIYDNNDNNDKEGNVWP